MKIRNGFVSNSSSSSFIVAVSPKHKGKVKIIFEVNLDEMTDNRIKNIDELHNLIEHDYDGKITEMPDYRKCLKALSEGKEILIGSFSNESDDPVSQLLCDIGIPKSAENEDFQIIFNEPGY